MLLRSFRSHKELGNNRVTALSTSRIALRTITKYSHFLLCVSETIANLRVNKTYRGLQISVDK